MAETVSPEEIIQVRKSLRYSVAEFAKLMDVSVETARSWESGRRTCKGPSAALIRLFEKMPEAGHMICRWRKMPIRGDRK
jgi:DNA-binding transcriptional regulator YiaG